MSDFREDFRESGRIARLAAPHIKELFMQIPYLFTTNDLKIYTVENDDELGCPSCKVLDKICGIDYLVVSETDNRVIGMAWRAVKFLRSKYPDNEVYNGFSVRQKRDTTKEEARCEMRKRENQIMLGTIFPTYTVQAHYDPSDDTLLSLALARTTDIYQALYDGLYRVCNPHGKNKEVYFYDVLWDKMKDAGYVVYDWYKDDSCRGYFKDR